MIGPLFDIFIGAIFFFLIKITKYVETKNRLAHLHWDFLEVG